MTRYAHACVVGGSGMLAGFSRALLDVSGTVSIAARNAAKIREIDTRIVPVVCDFNQEDHALEQLRASAALHGAPDLLVAWIHGRAPQFRRALAGLVRPGGRFVQVLGSAHADPARPDRLEAMRVISDGLEVSAGLVVLGFVVNAGGSRWLTNEEISKGVHDAVIDEAPFRIVGTVEPWPARP